MSTMCIVWLAVGWAGGMVYQLNLIGILGAVSRRDWRVCWASRYSADPPPGAQPSQYRPKDSESLMAARPRSPLDVPLHI